MISNTNHYSRVRENSEVVMKFTQIDKDIWLSQDYHKINDYHKIIIYDYQWVIGITII